MTARAHLKYAAWSVALAIGAAMLSGGAHAELAFDPQTACDYLAAERLGGLKYHDMGKGVFRCASPRRTLPYGGDVQNEMQYEAWGDAKRVNRLELHFKLYGLEDRQPTLTKMLKLGETLSQNALSMPLPDAIRTGILADTPAQAETDAARYSVLRDTAGYGGFGALILRIE
jgi:hypothetical protein